MKKNTRSWSYTLENCGAARISNATKLALKQANNAFDKLYALQSNEKTTPEQYAEFYGKMRKTHLYIKHGPLYTQVLYDVRAAIMDKQYDMPIYM